MASLLDISILITRLNYAVIHAQWADNSIHWKMLPFRLNLHWKASLLVKISKIRPWPLLLLTAAIWFGWILYGMCLLDSNCLSALETELTKANESIESWISAFVPTKLLSYEKLGICEWLVRKELSPIQKKAMRIRCCAIHPCTRAYQMACSEEGGWGCETSDEGPGKESLESVIKPPLFPPFFVFPTN